MTTLICAYGILAAGLIVGVFVVIMLLSISNSIGRMSDAVDGMQDSVGEMQKDVEAMRADIQDTLAILNTFASPTPEAP